MIGSLLVNFEIPEGFISPFPFYKVYINGVLKYSHTKDSTYLYSRFLNLGDVVTFEVENMTNRSDVFSVIRRDYTTKDDNEDVGIKETTITGITKTNNFSFTFTANTVSNGYNFEYLIDNNFNFSPTPTPTATVSPTATPTPTVSATSTPTPTPSNTPLPTSTPTPTPTVAPAHTLVLWWKISNANGYSPVYTNQLWDYYVTYTSGALSGQTPLQSYTVALSSSQTIKIGEFAFPSTFNNATNVTLTVFRKLSGNRPGGQKMASGSPYWQYLGGWNFNTLPPTFGQFETPFVQGCVGTFPTIFNFVPNVLDNGRFDPINLTVTYYHIVIEDIITNQSC